MNAIQRRKAIARNITKRILSHMLEIPAVGQALDCVRKNSKEDWRELVQALEFHCSREMKLSSDQWAAQQNAQILKGNDAAPPVTELAAPVGETPV